MFEFVARQSNTWYTRFVFLLSACVGFCIPEVGQTIFSACPTCKHQINLEPKNMPIGFGGVTKIISQLHRDKAVIATRLCIFEHSGWAMAQACPKAEGFGRKFLPTMSQSYYYDSYFFLCVCVSTPVSKDTTLTLSNLPYDFPDHCTAAGGQRPVFLRCSTKLQKTGGSIQGRLNVYLLSIV